MKHLLTLAAAGILIALAACTGSKGWSLSGSAPRDVETAYLEAPTTAGGWYMLDSAAIADGRFSFKLPAANGTIYRLRLGNKTVYLPADSTESLTLGPGGRRAGSAEALLFNAVDSAMPAGARAVLRALNGNYASTAAYYATRLLADRLLIRTVANRYSAERPSDPRTAILLADMRRLAAPSAAPAQQIVIEAPEISYFDVELMDRNGSMRKLSDAVSANPTVVLAYVDLASADAPAITRALGDARSAGAEIFEVGFHANQHLWAEATQGLPWTNVYQSEAADDTHMGLYRVTSLPMFIIIRNGEIAERISDYTKLPK